jgi:hypothetical protein
MRVQARDGAKEGGMSDRIGQKLAREKRVADAARAFPKGPTRKAVKAKKDRAEAKVKKTVRQIVADRDINCRAGAWRVADFHISTSWDRTAGPCHGLLEWAHFGAQRRAYTRGQAPELRHTSGGSLILCKFHHMAYDAGLLKIKALTDAGCDGPLEFTC